MAGKPTNPEYVARAVKLRQRLQKAREPVYSREELARKAGISAAEVEAVETGRVVVPGFFVVADLARSLGLRLDDLDRATRRRQVRG